MNKVKVMVTTSCGVRISIWGDHVICNSCGEEMIVNTGSTICPNCKEEGNLIWADEYNPHVDIDEFAETHDCVFV